MHLLPQRFSRAYITEFCLAILNALSLSLKVSEFLEMYCGSSTDKPALQHSFIPPF